jgi:hypothetical protein
MVELLDKIVSYIGGKWGLIGGVGFNSLALFFNPILILRLSDFGTYLMIFAFLLSLMHARLFQIFFVFILLEANIPKFSDRKFWACFMFFIPILFLWAYMETKNMDWWVSLHG